LGGGVLLCPPLIETPLIETTGVWEVPSGGGGNGARSREITFVHEPSSTLTETGYVPTMSQLEGLKV